MTPEQKKEFEEAIEQLKIGLPQGETVAPVAQEAPEEVQAVDVGDIQLPDDKSASPVDDALKALDAGSEESKVLEQANPFAAFEGERALDKDIREEDGVKLVNPPQFDMDRHERAKQAIPNFEAFMREMDQQGKLNGEGFLNDDAAPVEINGADIDEVLQANNQNQGGNTLMAWVRKQEEWKRQVIRGFETSSTIDEIQTGLLREIVDGMIRRHS